MLNPAAACVLLLLASLPAAAGPAPATGPVATFSIVAGDPVAGELGVAVASRFFAVGSVVLATRAFKKELDV